MKKGLLLIGIMSAMVSANAELVAHWAFDDGTCGDAVGKLNGTLKGNVQIVDSGREGFGKAAAIGFDDKDSIVLGDLSVLGIYTNSFTLSMWIRHAPLPATGENSPLFWDTKTGNSSLGYNGVQCVIRKGSDANGGRVYAVVGGPSGIPLLKGARVDNDKWHWIVIRYDSGSKQLSYFEDGQHITSRDVTGVYSFNQADAGKKALLGAGFGGMIDEVRIYNTALSSRELGELY